MLNDQKLHFISTDVVNFLVLKLGLLENDFEIPESFNPTEYEGSHINWTKDESRFCYINKHRLDHYDLTNYDDLYNYEKRYSGAAQATTTPKFRRIFAKCGVKLSANAEAKLDAYFAAQNNQLEYKIIDTPSEIYCLDNVFTGTFGTSCMQGKPESYFEMYDNEECFQLLVAYSNGNIVGRSLIAKAEDNTYMDRRYGNDDNIQLAMQEYGLSQGWYVKSNNNHYSICSWLHRSDHNHSTEISLNVGLDDYDNFPYMDTFKYGERDECILSTEEANHSGRQIVLEDTHGGFSESECCSRCDARVSQDKIHGVVDSCDGEIDVCQRCFDEHYTRCEDCDEYTNDGLYTSDDRYICECCLENYVRCDECDEYSHMDNVRYFPKCEVHICDNCM